MEAAELIPKVVEQLKTSGQVRPTMYAQLTQGSPRSYPLLHFEGDGRMKAHLLFVEGRQAGQAASDRDLIETILVSEVWLTKGQNPTPGRRPPAGIPYKEAVLFARALNSAPFQTRLQHYEIKRKSGKQGKPGQIKELVSFGKEIIDPEGLMGLAFIAGWRSRHLSNEEVQRLQPRGMRAFLTL
jgi:hypothetical protein